MAERACDAWRTVRHLRAIVESAHDAIVTIDTRGRIRAVNAAATAMFGYARDEMLGADVGLLMDADAAARHHAHVAAFGRAGASRVIGRNRELLARRKDGTILPVEIVVSDATIGRERLLTAIVRDVSERAAAAAALARAHASVEAQVRARTEELEHARAAADAASRAKSEFLAVMSHEIRTPIHGVLGMTHLLLETALGPEQRQYAETVRSSGEALRALIDDVLDFSRLETGKVVLESVAFDPRALVEDTVALLADRADAKGLELVCLVEDVAEVVVGDPSRLRQVLLNLVGNAVKFTDRGEVVVHVAAVADDPGPGPLLRIRVSDTGIGVASHARDRVFEAFAQGDAATNRTHGGTGLGLAITRRLVEAMGGTIGIEERPVGSTFWCTVRLHRFPGSPPSPAPPLLRGRRVLAAVAHPLHADALCAGLRAAGLHVVQAPPDADLAERLRAAAHAVPPIDAAVLDATEAAAAALRTSPVPVVLLRAPRTPAPPAPPGVRVETAGTPIRRQAVLRALGTLLAAEAAAAPVRTPASPPPATGGRVLVVDVNPVNRRVAIANVRKLGYEAEGVETGREAVAAVRRQPYDLVFMDCQMPEMDGYEATAAIRAGEPPGTRVPIVALTANVLPENRERCLRAGMDDYVTKPFTAVTLGAVLTRWIRRTPPADALADAPPSPAPPA